MAMARSPWLNCGATITLSKHQLLRSLPLSGTVVQTKSRQISKADLTRTLEVASGKSAYKLVISRLFEVLALQAPTKYELVVNLKTAKCSASIFPRRRSPAQTK